MAKKRKILLITLSILIFLTISSSVSYLIKKSSTSNEFTKGTIKIELNETFEKENNTKKDINVKNIGNSDVFVKVAIIYNFINKDNQVLEEIPEKDIDYTIEFPDNSNWIEKDGYYYYKKILKENETTENLINEIKQIKEYNDKTLEIDVLAQAIQAQPTRAVKDAWNIDIKNNEIIGE